MRDCVVTVGMQDDMQCPVTVTTRDAEANRRPGMATEDRVYMGV